MGVAATLTKAFCFIGIILLGIALRRIGFFREEDFPLLSKIVLKITLPAAIAANFANKEIDPGMLSLCLLGFLGGVLYILLAFLLNAKNSRKSLCSDEPAELQYRELHSALCAELSRPDGRDRHKPF